MLAGTLAFSAGIYCLLQFGKLPSSACLLALPFLCLLALRYRKLQILFWFFLGFGWGLIRIDYLLEQPVIDSITASAGVIKGVVVSAPKIYNDSVRFHFKVDDFSNGDFKSSAIKKTVKLSWYHPEHIPEPGESWQFNVKLKRPYSFMNPGGFDYEFWLLRQGVVAVGYIKPGWENQLLGRSSVYFVEQTRNKIAHKLKQHLQQPLLGFALALSLGDRSELKQREIKTLQRTGTSHLLAISGLHLSLVAGIVFFVCNIVVRQSCTLTRLIPAPYIAALTALTAAFVYALLAGFTLPTQRALIMIAVFFLSYCYGHRLPTITVISFAVLLILVLDPFAVIAVDFWLSFVAVSLIIYLTKYRKIKNNKLMQWVRLQILLSISLFPVLVFWFKQLPIYSAPANLVAIPVIGLIIVPLLLFALALLFLSPTYSLTVYRLIAEIHDLHWRFLDFLAQQDLSLITIASPNRFSLMLAFVGVVIIFLPKGLPARYLGLLWLLPLLYPAISKPVAGRFDFTLLDVGQGLSAVVQTERQVLIYDTGARFSDRFDIGRAVITPFLKHKGINTISTLVVSHGDNDHIGGSESLLDEFKIDKVLTGVPDKFNNRRVERCRHGQQWNWDGVRFEILHPMTDNSAHRGNNGSCVLRISGQYGAVLLTGDIEQQAEWSLLRTSPDKLAATVLVVPHHGSRTSSTREFIGKVNPEYAFFPVGYRNRFGFPKQDIIDRYRDLGIKTRLTWLAGAISVKFGPNGVDIDEFRTRNRRLWHFQ